MSLPSERTGTVFISYARGDGEEFARCLREKLLKAGVRLWQDRISLEGGRDWWLQIVEALEHVQFMLLVLTPKAITSPTVRKEWLAARQKGVCVYPVIGVKDLDFTKVPRWLRRTHAYDCEQDWEKLLHDLAKTPERIRVPFMAGDLPKDYVPRSKQVQEIIQVFCKSGSDEPTAATLALVGAGGFGKTTLARAVCHDERIQELFQDGILWVTLGEKLLDVTGRIQDLIEYLSGSRPGFSNLDAVTTRLRELLQDRDILVVIDDVWNEQELVPVLQATPHCSHLITTRNLNVVPLNAEKVELASMQEQEAVDLLAHGLVVNSPAEVRQLAKKLGQWPLLLKLANRALSERVRLGGSFQVAIRQVHEALERRGFTSFDSRDAHSRADAVAKTLGASVDQLLESEKSRYVELGIFQGDCEVPLGTLEKYWRHTGNLDEFETEALCIRLEQLSLLAELDLARRCFQMHGVITRLLGSMAGGDLSRFHREFLDACKPQQTGAGCVWAQLPLDEPYLWENLAMHLTGAGLGEELGVTASDPIYLSRKTFAKKSSAVESDLMAAEKYPGARPSLKLLRRALGQYSHLLNKCETLRDLQATLFARLHYLPELPFDEAKFAQEIPVPWLAPARPFPDLCSPALLRTLGGHSDNVMSCAFSPDGAYLVSTGDDETVRIWESLTGRLVRTVKGYRGRIRCCSILSDGVTLVYGNGDGTLCAVDLTTGDVLARFGDHAGGVRGCAASRNGNLFVSVASDGLINLWDSCTWSRVHCLSGHRGGVNDCVISSDKAFVVSASADGTLKSWQTQTGREMRTLIGHEDWVRACALTPDNEYVISASDDRSVRVWHRESGRLTRKLMGHKSPVSTCAVSPRGDLIASGSADKDLRLWETESGMEVAVLRGHWAGINSCAFSPDGQFLVSASDDLTAKLWSPQDCVTVPQRSEFGASIRACAVCDSGLPLVTSSGEGLSVWDGMAGNLKSQFNGHRDVVRCCSFIGNSGMVLSASDDQTLKLWDVEAGREIRTFRGHKGGVNRCAVSADGRFAASASDDRTVRIWEIETGSLMQTLRGHRGAVNGCTFGPNGRIVASASDDGKVILWDAEFGNIQNVFERHQNLVWNCAISENGRFLVSVSDDRTGIIWDLNTGQMVHCLSGFERGVTGCAVHPNSKWILTTSKDGTAKLWSAESGACLHTAYEDSWLYDCTWLRGGEAALAWGDAGLYCFELRK